MAQKPKVLIFSLAPPENHAGIRVLLYRHFVEHQDFDFRLVTDTVFATKPYEHLRVDLGRIGRRVRITRFHQWAIDYQNFVWPFFIPREVHDLVQAYQPDVILTVPDNSLSHLAARVASHYGLPLVGLFMDWLPEMKDHVGHAWTIPALERRFRSLHQKCDLAVCISEGMRKRLGKHRNAHVIYPIPASRAIFASSRLPGAKRPLRIVYTGSVYGFYGKMLCRLFRAVLLRDDIELKIVGPNPDWPEEDMRLAKEKNVYLGFKNTEELRDICQDADFLLVVMSFQNSDRNFVETCFTTKFVDYTAWGKPIIVWSPEYSAVARFVAHQMTSLLISIDSPEEVLKKASEVFSCPDQYFKYGDSSRLLRMGIFDPDNLQKELVDSIHGLIHT